MCKILFDLNKKINIYLKKNNILYNQQKIINNINNIKHKKKIKFQDACANPRTNR